MLQVASVIALSSFLNLQPNDLLDIFLVELLDGSVPQLVPISIVNAPVKENFERIHVDRVYQTTSGSASEYLTMIDMKHIINGEESTVTAAFRAKRSFLSLMMQEPQKMQLSLINSAIVEKKDYNQKANPTAINFIIPLSGRSDSVRIFLDRRKVAALSHEIHINVKVVYFANDDHSTPEDEAKLQELMEAAVAKR